MTTYEVIHCTKSDPKIFIQFLTLFNVKLNIKLIELITILQFQAKYGDFQKDLHQPGFLSNDRLLPERVSQQHKLSKEDWEQRITNW